MCCIYYIPADVTECWSLCKKIKNAFLITILLRSKFHFMSTYRYRLDSFTCISCLFHSLIPLILFSEKNYLIDCFISLRWFSFVLCRILPAPISLNNVLIIPNKCNVFKLFIEKPFSISIYLDITLPNARYICLPWLAIQWQSSFKLSAWVHFEWKVISDKN